VLPTLKVRLAGLLFCLAAIILLVPRSEAHPRNLAGTYECTHARVHGKVVPCHSAPLELKKDGSFELRGWEGNYVVAGDWVELSDSEVKSRAKIEAGHKIIFQYHGKDGIVEVIYERRVAVLGKMVLG
jgi:hypothetical protein